MEYQSVNPFDTKVVKSFAEIMDKQLEDKLALATACFASWKKKSYADRAKVVNKAAELLHDRTDEFAHIMTLECSNQARPPSWYTRLPQQRHRRLRLRRGGSPDANQAL